MGERWVCVCVCICKFVNFVNLVLMVSCMLVLFIINKKFYCQQQTYTFEVN